jgi:hypothetical protein
MIEEERSLGRKEKKNPLSLSLYVYGWLQSHTRM